MNKIRSIELLRGFAAFVVVLHHVLKEVEFRGLNNSLFINFYNLKDFGNIGVDIFFVISGFIMIYIHKNDFQKEKASLIFLKKRFIRVIPLYWIITTVASLALIFSPQLSSSGKTFEIDYAIASYLFIPYKNAIGSVMPIVNPGWTLNFEMYFYIIFAFFLFFKKKYFLPFISFYFILSIVLINLIVTPNEYIKMMGNPLLFEFLFGIFIGYYYTKIPEKVHLILYLGLILILINIFIPIDNKYRVIFYGLPAGILVLGLLIKENYNNLKIPFKIDYMGTISYSLYLSHIFAYKIAIILYLKVIGYKYPDILILFTLLFCIICAYFTYILFEKPVTIYLKNKYFKKTKN